MNGEHLYDLRQRNSGHAGDMNAVGDEFQAILTDAWAISLVLAAYDHELFHPYRPGNEGVWNATLQELLGARARILASVIPRRLMEYRSWNTPLATVPIPN